MEKQNNNEYGHTDPDFIDQNTLVDGNNIQSEDQYTHKAPTEQTTEFGESDPDYIDQNTLVDTDNYARDEDPYQYKEGYIEDLKNLGNDFENNSNSSSEKTEDQHKNVSKDSVNSSDKKDNKTDEDQE
ncbi:hypothetical protein [Flavobacterium aquidurense]|uniref:Uncharacterized protein n=1 Tax=Flavobacterium aquidurense TaxID=362413 RepID=A0A0Q0RYW8_9FLAO|nr:hypothetical protein [Flavobacterium aquidurense]KQB42688.1 hypothetical protein RC62_3695 [Flavobacterium aquidurense]